MCCFDFVEKIILVAVEEASKYCAGAFCRAGSKLAELRFMVVSYCFGLCGTGEENKHWRRANLYDCSMNKPAKQLRIPEYSVAGGLVSCCPHWQRVTRRANLPIGFLNFNRD